MTLVKNPNGPENRPLLDKINGCVALANALINTAAAYCGENHPGNFLLGHISLDQYTEHLEQQVQLLQGLEVVIRADMMSADQRLATDKELSDMTAALQKSLDLLNDVTAQQLKSSKRH